MKVSELGEFGLIRMLSQIVGASKALYDSTPNLILGIGDDAAAWKTSEPVQLATTDILVESVHFDLSQTSWHDLGWKAMAVNMSDIAAMGGTPKHALISLGMPPDTEVEHITELYRGIASMARRFNMSVVGGDITRSPNLIISPTVIGETAKERLMSRATAAAGDLIAVTGTLGASAAGLRMMQQKLTFDEKVANLLREAHCKPNPRIFEGLALSQSGVVCAIDISDGLMADLGHICQSSKIGAEITLDDIPVHPVVKAAFGQDASKLALSGGEDYELLFTAPAGIIQKIKNLRTLAVPITVIGKITKGPAGKVSLSGPDGKEVEFQNRGWDHFRND